MEGRVIATVEQRRGDLRFAFPPGFAQKLQGRKIVRMWRRSKYMLAALEPDLVLLMHLGMTGRFTVLPPDGRARHLGEFYHEAGGDGEATDPHDHVVFTMEDGTRIVYNDARRFGFMDLFSEAEQERHKLLKDLGPEPMGNSFDAGHLAVRFRGKKAPLKAALLDQSVVAGLGNIYVSEALFRAGLSPRRKASTLASRKRPDPRLDDLVRHIRDILDEAISAGGSTLQDFAGATGAEGSFQQRFRVYDREGEPCMKCGGPLKRIVQSGRSTFFCPSCQK